MKNSNNENDNTDNNFDSSSENSDISKKKAEEYLEYQKKTIASLVVGAKDLSGHVIKNIYARGDEYVIYDNAENILHQSIKILILTSKEDDLTKILALNSVKENFDKLKMRLYRSGDNPLHKQRAASAIVMVLQEPDKFNDVNRLLLDIAKDIEEEFESRLWGRLSYLGGALTITSISIIIAIIVYVLRGTPFFTTNSLLLYFLYCSMFSSIGGFFSVSLKSQSIFIMQATNKWMYFLYGLERNIIAVIAGIACFVLISSGILFSNLKDGNTGIFFMMTICFFSGFSEKFIPNALSSIGSESNQKTEQ